MRESADAPGGSPELEDALALLPRVRPGECIGDFVVDAFVAAGAWSDVYRARHRSRDLGPIALKVRALHLGRGTVIRSLTGIPHLVEVHAAGDDPGRGIAYVAMRFVDGTTLDRLSGGGATPPRGDARRRVVERCAEVAGALAELHARSLLHCDVKPSNILVEGHEGTPDEAAVLVDLDFARSSTDASSLTTTYATVPYAAPEQLLGLLVDGRADVFGLGLCLHDLLAGRNPDRRGKRPAAGMEPLESLVPDVDPDLAAIVAEAVEPDPDRRYSSARELADDLRGWLAGRPPMVRPRGIASRVVRCWRRRPTVFWRRATVAVVMVGLTWTAAGTFASHLEDERTRGAIERSLRDGDLAGAVRLDAALGPWPHLARASPLESAAARDAGLTALLEQIRDGRLDDGLEFAARLLARDGIERHPQLDAWLEWQARHDGPAGLRAAALRSHVLFDRPVEDTTGPHAAARRDRLLQLVQCGDERALHALAALGGAAGTADLPRIVPAVQLAAASHPARLELVRLGVEVGNRIAAREGGTPAALAVVEAAFRCTTLWLREQPDRAAMQPILEAPVQAWLFTIARLRAGCGSSPPDLATLHLPWPPTIVDLALAGDRAGFAAARSRPGIEADPYRLGFASGLLAAAGAPEPSPQWAEATWPKQRAAYAVGFRAGRGAFTGPWRAHAIDPGTGLADALVADATMRPLDGRPGTIEEAPAGVLAAWSFLAPEPRCCGSAIAVDACAVRRGTDEVEADSHFLLLTCAGVSAVQLVFREPAEHRPSLALVMSAQKAQRGALPYGGEAGLDVLLDGLRIGTVWDLGSSAWRHLSVPLGRTEVGRERRLEIRLRLEANTTVRLFSAWIQ